MTYTPRRNPPKPPPAPRCYACLSPSVGRQHTCSESIRPEQVVTPHLLTAAHVAAEATAPAVPTAYDMHKQQQIVAVVNELGDYATGYVESWAARGDYHQVVAAAAAAIGTVERLAVLAARGELTSGAPLLMLSDLTGLYAEHHSPPPDPSSPPAPPPLPPQRRRRGWRLLRRTAVAAAGLALGAAVYLAAYHGMMAVMGR